MMADSEGGVVLADGEGEQAHMPAITVDDADSQDDGSPIELDDAAPDHDEAASGGGDEAGSCYGGTSGDRGPSKRFPPAPPTSDEALYLEEAVWPTLLPALEKLLKAIRKFVPEDVRATYDDPSMSRTLFPEDAVGFDPMQWLALYLKRYNPNQPSQYTDQSAATRIQASWRAHEAKKEAGRRRSRRDQLLADQAEEQRREEAARLIQSVYRGHSVRVAASVNAL